MACGSCDDQCYCAIGAGDTSIAVTGNGGGDLPYAVRVRRSAQTDNQIQMLGDGLYVASNAAASGGLIIATSSTRPSPTNGRTVWETDTYKLQTYTTSTTGWKAPWNLPWGRVAHMSYATSMSTSSTTGAAFSPAFTVSFTAVANRYYRVSCFLPLTHNTPGAHASVIVIRGTGITGTEIMGTAVVAYPWNNANLSAIVSESAGTVSYTVNWYTNTGIVTTNNAAAQPALLLVEDVGPSGNPV